jgi:hypothetical protein
MYIGITGNGPVTLFTTYLWGNNTATHDLCVKWNFDTKILSVWQDGQFKSSVNASSLVIQSPDYGFFGHADGYQKFDGYLENLRLYNEKLSDTKCLLLSGLDFEDSFDYVWDAQSLVDYQNNDPVGTWTDVLNSVDLSQVDDAKKPLFKSDVFGFPAVMTDGINDVLSTTDAGVVLSGDAFSESAAFLFVIGGGTSVNGTLPGGYSNKTTGIGYIQQAFDSEGYSVKAYGNPAAVTANEKTLNYRGYNKDEINFMLVTVSIDQIKVYRNGILIISAVANTTWINDVFAIGGRLSTSLLTPTNTNFFAVAVARGLKADKLHSDPSAMFENCNFKWKKTTPPLFLSHAWEYSGTNGVAIDSTTDMMSGVVANSTGTKRPILYIDGPISYAYFDGVDAEQLTTTNVNLTAGYMYCALINLASPTLDYRVLYELSNGIVDARGLLLVEAAAIPALYNLRTTATGLIASATTAPTGEWFMLTAVHVGASSEIFLNRTSIATGAVTRPFDSQPIRFGRGTGVAAANGFKGGIAAHYFSADTSEFARKQLWDYISERYKI